MLGSGKWLAHGFESLAWPEKFLLPIYELSRVFLVLDGLRDSWQYTSKLTMSNEHLLAKKMKL